MLKRFRYFWGYCWRLQKSYTLLMLLGEIFKTIVFVSGIIFPRYIIEALFEERMVSRAAGCAALFLGILLAAGFLQALSKYYAERSRDQMYRKFSLDYARKIMEGDFRNMEDPAYMDLKEKALKCMAGNYGFAGTIFLAADLFGRILTLSSTIAIVITLDPVIMVIFAVLIILNVRVNNRMGEKNAHLDLDVVPAKRREDYFHQLGDGFRFAKEIRLDGLRDWILSLYREQFAVVHGFTKRKNANLCIGQAGGNLSVFLQQCTAYGYLIYQVLKGEIGMGGFTMYLSAILSFNSNVTQLLTTVGRLSQSCIYLEPFEEFMEYPRSLEVRTGEVQEKSGEVQEKSGKVREKSVETQEKSGEVQEKSGEVQEKSGKVQERSGEAQRKSRQTRGDVGTVQAGAGTGGSVGDYIIRFEHVSFRYPGQQQYALKDVSCVLHPGEKIAVVGENGAGKSTFVKLLTRLYDPSEGAIYLNDRDIRTIPYEEYLGIFSVVFQDYKLFAMTIRENIGMKRTEEIGGDELMRTADSIGLGEKVRKLEKGFETPVYKVFDEGGFEPSGGEAQKIAIARAFMKNTPVVILDEPTAALDPRAEYEIYQDFAKLTSQKTAVYISHRLASCRICDRIFVFRGGGIEERGTHEELMAQDGYYAGIFKMQAALYSEGR